MAKGTLSKTVSIYVNGQQVDSTLKSLQSELRKLQNEQRLATIGSEDYVEKSLKIREIKQVLQDQAEAVKGLEKRHRDLLDTLNDVGGALTAVKYTLNIFGSDLGNLKGAIDQAAKMSDAYAAVQKTTGLTAEEVRLLNEEFKKMDTRTSREQLNQLAYEAGKLGISGVEAVKGFVAAADKINVALGDELGEGAMVTIGKLADLFQQTTGQLDGKGVEEQMLAIGSAINSLGAASSASEGDMVNFMQRIAGVATQAGLGADAVLGYASVLSQSGVAMETSATNLQRIIGQMFRKPAEFAAAAGMSVRDFSELCAKDMNGALQALLKGLQEAGGMDKLTPVLDEMGLKGSGAVQVLSTLASRLDDIGEAQQIAATQLRDGTSIGEEFATVNETSAAQMEKLQNRMADVKEELGERLMPLYVQAFEAVASGTKTVGDLIGRLSESREALAAVTAAIGGYVLVKGRQLYLKASEAVTDAAKAARDKVQNMLTAMRTAQEAKHTLAIERKRQAEIALELTEMQRIATSKTLMYTSDGYRRKMEAEARMVQLLDVQKEQDIIVTKAQTAAEKAHAAAMAATPWGAVAAAIGLAAGALIPYIAQTKDGASVTQSLIKESTTAKAEVGGLFKSLATAATGSDLYKKALTRLKELYPEIIQKHIDEQGNLKNLKKAFDDVTDSISKQITKRIRLQKMEEASASLGDAVGEQTENIYKKVQGIFKGTNTDPNQFYADSIRPIIDALRQGEIDAREAASRVRNAIDQATGKSGGQYSLRDSYRLDSLFGSIYKIQNAMKDYQSTVEEVETTLGAVATKTEEANSAFDGMNTKQLEEEMQRLTSEAARLQGQLDDIDAGNASMAVTRHAEKIGGELQKVKEKMEALKKYQDGLKGNGNSFTSGTGETGNAAEESKKDAEKARKAWESAAEAADKAMEQMAAKRLTGLAKTLAEIEAKAAEAMKRLQAIGGSHQKEAEAKIKELQESVNKAKAKAIAAAADEARKKVEELREANVPTSGNTYLDQMNKAAADFEKGMRSMDQQVAQWERDAEAMEAVDAAEAGRLREQIEQYKRLREELRRVAAEKAVAAAGGDIKGVDTSGFTADDTTAMPESLREYNAELDAIRRNYDDLKQKIADSRAEEEELIAALEERAATETDGEARSAILQEIVARRANLAALQEQEEELDRVKQKKEELADNRRLMASAKEAAEAFQSVTEKMMDAFSSIGTILDNIGERELKEATKRHDEEVELLDDQLEKGIISQETYNERKQGLDEELTKKEQEMEVEQFERQKLMNIAQAAINGALAIMNVWATTPTPAAPAMSAVVAALTALQIAAIASEPAPYARGGYVNRRTVYQAGERGREWVASNELLRNPETAGVIEWLEAVQRRRVKPSESVPMARANMPAATAAARQIAERQRPMRQAAAVADASRGELLDEFRMLRQYMEDPRNRQAVISRQTQLRFDEQENFLRQRARI